jgi:EAL domain-containing protein (putative c-di-GMP-specific phosphodiesterase class I)
VAPQALGSLLEQWRPFTAPRLPGVKADYQADGRVLGVETLVRWRHPGDGMVFPDQLIGVAEAHGLIDELTRVVLHDALARLRLKRFGLSIDDFGTGHSSLSQLRDIPFDGLKIDQGFVHRAHADETLRAIFEASPGLARQLGMEVVAEGVEDRDDWDFLRRVQCDLAQGYFIARPMPAAELPGWIASWQARLGDLAPSPF